MAASNRPARVQTTVVRNPTPVTNAQVSRIEEFKADSDSLNMLLEMGYPRNDALIALKVTNNDLEQAATFLMNNPNPAQSLGYQVHVAQVPPV